MLAFRDLRSWVLAPLWLLASLAWLWAWMPTSWQLPLSRRQIQLISGVLFLAAAARLYRLADLQPIQIDELYLAHVVVGRAWASWEDPGGPLGLFAMSAADSDGQQMLAAYRRLLVLLVGGVSLTTLRLTSALLGIAEVGLLFLVGLRLFGFRVALAAAILLATLTAHLTFSRSGLDNVEASFMWTLGMLTLAWGLSARRAGGLALAGLVLGLSLYFYPSARALIPAVLALLATAAIDPAHRGRWLVSGIGALAAGFVVGAGPVLVAYIHDPATFFYRSSTSAWLGAALTGLVGTGDPAELLPLWQHFRDAFLAYSLVPSADNRYWPERPLFLPVPAALLAGGVVLVSVRLTNWRYRLLALWFWVPTVALSALSDHTPAIHRSLPALPACALLIGLALDRIAAALRALGAWPARLAAPLLGAALGISAVHEGALYFVEYSARDLWPTINGMVQHVLASPPGRHIVLLTSQPALYELSFATAGGRRNSSEVLMRPADQVPETLRRPQGVSYLVHPDRAPWLRLLKEAYPAGVVKDLVTRDETIVGRLGTTAEGVTWYVFDVTAEDVDAQQGLRLSVIDGQDRQFDRRVDAVILPTDLPNDLVYPLRIEWRGWIQPPLDGRQPVRIAVDGGVVPRLQIGDVAIDLTDTRLDRPREAQLRPGRQPLMAAAMLHGPTDTVRLAWERPNHAPWSAFPLGFVVAWPDRPRVVIDWLTPDGGQLLRRDYDITIADQPFGRRPAGPGPWLVRYRSILAVEQPGSHQFELRGDGAVRLLIDGRQVWPQSGEGPSQLGAPERNRARVSIPAGLVPIVVEQTDGGSLALLWQQGSSPPSLLPPSALAPVPWP